MTDKHCVNCKHAQNTQDFGGRHACCRAPKNVERFDGVTGARVWRYHACKFQREDNWLVCRIYGLCGREGRWFEPKDETK